MEILPKITIRNFGPVSSCELDLKKFMIFIGEQSTGKSTICKCIYFFKTVRDEVKYYLHNIQNNGINFQKRFPKCLNSELKSKFVNLFGVSKFKGNFTIRYEYDHGITLEVTVTNDQNRYLDFNFSHNLIQQVKSIEEQANNDYENLNSKEFSSDLYKMLEKEKLFIAIERQLNVVFNDEKENFYIPAGRGVLTLLTNTLLSIELSNLDYITRDFMKLIQRERPVFDVELLAVLKKLDLKMTNIAANELVAKLKEILKGEYSYKEQKEYIRLKNRALLPINYASSGQQEVLWILNLLFLWTISGKKVFVVIEEPEAHLFPNAQKDVVDFISLFFNSNDNQIMITTHSPYILTSANNLLYAGKVGLKNKDKVNEVINSKYWIASDLFGAYMVGKRGNQYVRPIIDDDLGEIASEEIDTVSNYIRSNYSKIFNVEVENDLSE